MARLNVVKDQGTLLRAAREVVDRYPAFRLDLVGDGPERGALERLRRDLGLEDHVRLVGYREDVQALLQASDVFVLTSRSEGLALTLLEAMAAGLPVVATDVGGNREVVARGETGLLVAAGSPTAVADALLSLIEDPAQRPPWGKRDDSASSACSTSGRWWLDTRPCTTPSCPDGDPRLLMRLLFLSVVYPNALEPTKGTFNQSFVEALAANHQVQVVAPLLWTVRWRLERWARNDVETPAQSVPVSVAHPVFYYTPKILRPWYAHFLWLSIRRTLEPILESFKPEAVVGYWAHPDGAVAVRAARKAGALAGLIVGGSDLLLLTRDAARRRAILDVLHEVDALFTVGSDLRKRALELGVRPDKVHDFRQGVDTQRFFPGDPREARERLSLAASGPMLVWVGRMLPVKGLEVLLEACRLLHGERPGLPPGPGGRRPPAAEARGGGRGSRARRSGPVRGCYGPPRPARLVSGG